MMKKMTRRMLSLTMALLLVLSLPLSALAADYEASNYGELETAFSGSGNAAGDTTVNVNVTNDIDFGGSSLNTSEGWSYNISSSNNSSLNNASFIGNESGDGAGSVVIKDMDLGGDTGLTTSRGVDVTVTGDITGENMGIWAEDGSSVTVTGDVTGENYIAIEVNNSTVNVTGDATGYYNGISASDSTVNVTGDVTGQTMHGVNARHSSDVTVTGDVSGYTDAVTAYDESHVTVTGNVSSSGYDGVSSGEGSSVTVNGDVSGNRNGINVYKEGTVTVNGDVSGNEYGIRAWENGTATVTGNVTGGNDGIHAESGANVAVTGNVTGTDDGVYGFSSTLKVTGDVTGGEDGIEVFDNSSVTVDGNVSGSFDGVYSDSSTVEIIGNVSGGVNGIESWNSDVTVEGCVAGMDGDPDAVDYSDFQSFSDGGKGANITDTRLAVTGNITGGNGYGTWGYGGTALDVDGLSVVNVGGSVIGGSVTADPATETEEYYESQGGDGVDMDDPESIVFIGGDAIGGSTNGKGGLGGCGVILEVESTEYPAGSLTVGGKAIGGKAPNGEDGYGIHVDNDENLLKDAVIPVISLGGYDSLSYEDVEDDELVDLIRRTGLPFVEWNASTQTTTFWGHVLKQIQAAEKGATLTVDAGERTTMPATIVEAVKEYGVTLVIQWDGGADISIGANFNKEAIDGVYLLNDM